jgi:hypothetical protein
MAQQLELEVISSPRMETRVGPEEGDFRAKKIGDDTYDVFGASLGIGDAEPEISAGTTLRTMARVEAAYRSGREGHVLPHLGTVPEMVAP